MSSPIKQSSSPQVGSTGFQSQVSDSCLREFINYNSKEYEVVFKFKNESDRIYYEKNFDTKLGADFASSNESLFEDLEGTTKSEKTFVDGFGHTITYECIITNAQHSSVEVVNYQGKEYEVIVNCDRGHKEFYKDFAHQFLENLKRDDELKKLGNKSIKITGTRKVGKEDSNYECTITRFKLRKLKYTPLQEVSSGLTGIIGKIKSLFGNAEKRIQSYIALAADSLAEGADENIPRKTIAKSLQSTPSGSLKLDHATIHTNSKSTIITPANFITAYQEYAKNPNAAFDRLLMLKPREPLITTSENCMIFSENCTGHHMVGMLVKQSNGKYAFFQFNSGQGIEKHPFDKSSNKYQVPLILYDLTETEARELVGFASEEVTKGTYQMYNKLNGLAKKNQRLWSITPKKGEKFWMTPQVGGSCSAQAELAMIRFMLTKSSFEKLNKKIRVRAIFKVYKEIEEGTDNSYRTKRAVLDMIFLAQKENLDQVTNRYLNRMKALLEPVTKDSVNFPEELKAKLKIYGIAAKELEKEPPSYLYLDNGLQALCFYIANNNYKNAKKLLERMHNIHPTLFTDDDRLKCKELIKAFFDIMILKNDQSLEGINAIAGVYELIRNNFPNCVKNPENYGITEEGQNMAFRYRANFKSISRDLFPSAWGDRIKAH